MAGKSPAAAYLRTSSPANGHPDGDSHDRQLRAVQWCAEKMGFSISKKHIFYDVGVSGRDVVPLDGGIILSGPSTGCMLHYLCDTPSTAIERPLR